MAAPQQFSLRWNNYSQHIVTALDDLRVDDELTDVTLSCDGQSLKAHKILLAACSSFFRDTFKENPCKHPIIIIKGVSFTDLEAVVSQFMYNGQVNVSQDRLQTFLAAAELFQIKGLIDVNDKEEPAKKRPPTHLIGNSSLNRKNSFSHSSSRSGTAYNVQRLPLFRKRKAVDTFTSGGLATSSCTFGVVTASVASQTNPEGVSMGLQAPTMTPAVDTFTDYGSSTSSCASGGVMTSNVASQTRPAGVFKALQALTIPPLPSLTTVVTTRTDCDCICFCDEKE